MVNCVKNSIGLVLPITLCQCIALIDVKCDCCMYSVCAVKILNRISALNVFTRVNFEINFPFSLYICVDFCMLVFIEHSFVKGVQQCQNWCLYYHEFWGGGGNIEFSMKLYLFLHVCVYDFS